MRIRYAHKKSTLNIFNEFCASLQYLARKSITGKTAKNLWGDVYTVEPMNRETSDVPPSSGHAEILTNLLNHTKDEVAAAIISPDHHLVPLS
jgi:hypothetical protein